jgi:hypothetical protein
MRSCLTRLLLPILAMDFSCRINGMRALSLTRLRAAENKPGQHVDIQVAMRGRKAFAIAYPVMLCRNGIKKAPSGDGAFTSVIRVD